jgi:hypothetical protein
MIEFTIAVGNSYLPNTPGKVVVAAAGVLLFKTCLQASWSVSLIFAFACGAITRIAERCLKPAEPEYVLPAFIGVSSDARTLRTAERATTPVVELSRSKPSQEKRYVFQRRVGLIQTSYRYFDEKRL